MITAIITEGVSSGSTFPEGSTYVKYQATDSSGNRAVCGFSVTIRGLCLNYHDTLEKKKKTKQKTKNKHSGYTLNQLI